MGPTLCVKTRLGEVTASMRSRDIRYLSDSERAALEALVLAEQQADTSHHLTEITIETDYLGDRCRYRTKSRARARGITS